MDNELHCMESISLTLKVNRRLLPTSTTSTLFMNNPYVHNCKVFYFYKSWITCGALCNIKWIFNYVWNHVKDNVFQWFNRSAVGFAFFFRLVWHRNIQNKHSTNTSRLRTNFRMIDIVKWTEEMLWWIGRA